VEGEGCRGSGFGRWSQQIDVHSNFGSGYPITTGFIYNALVTETHHQRFFTQAVGDESPSPMVLIEPAVIPPHQLFLQNRWGY
jgi:hypothetical protein